MAFVIKEHRPGRRLLVAVVILVLWVLSIWYAYETGWGRSNYSQVQAQSNLKASENRQKQQLKMNDALRSQVSILKRTAQVDREAKEELARELKELQELQADLREEISFYKSIIVPASGKEGLGVYSLKVLPLEDNMYHFKIVLTQSGKSDSLVEGVVEMRLKGVLKGREKELALKDIRVADTPKLGYKFRYFEELSGSFSLPEGYEPREVVVSLKPGKGKPKTIPVNTFDWLKVRLQRDDFNGW